MNMTDIYDNIRWKAELISFNAFGWLVVIYNGAHWLSALIMEGINKWL